MQWEDCCLQISFISDLSQSFLILPVPKIICSVARFQKTWHLSLKAVLIFLDVLVFKKRSRWIFVKAPATLSSCLCNRCWLVCVYSQWVLLFKMPFVLADIFSWNYGAKEIIFTKTVDFDLQHNNPELKISCSSLLNEWWVDTEHSCIWSKQENGARVLWQHCECLSHLFCTKWPQRLQVSLYQLLMPPWKLQPEENFDVPVLMLTLSSKLWIILDYSLLKEGSTAEQTAQALCEQPGRGSKEPNKPGVFGGFSFFGAPIADPVNVVRYFLFL